ncbi:hypothetical protein PS880_06315 [Pseudomonas fluorescens]|uniref:Uncharacterized protein n=1 Tax=Pseudomonas fluorescens TaxID=294 RepID=A0A5E7QJL2_PSEFL|nr:hypothetical protein PS880_06315 [Pseudomonas fluorescens]
MLGGTSMTQVPSPATVPVLVLWSGQVTTTVSPGVPVPDTSCVPLLLLSPMTTLPGGTGGVVSTVTRPTITDRAGLRGLSLPAASVSV